MCIVEGLLLGTANVELAENKVLRNDLAAPRSGVGGHRSRETLFLPYRTSN